MPNRIVFNREFPNHSGALVKDIFTINPDGSDLKRLTTNPHNEEWDCASPCWSPNGGQIAFAGMLRRPAINWTDLYIMQSDGSDIHRVSNGPYDNWDPDWSPDGSRIVFSRNLADVGPYSLWTVRPNGSDLTKIYSTGSSAVSPAWSPDGTKIVVECIEAAAPYYRDIVCIDSSDGSERWRTNFHAYATSPDWSPDGSRIAFSGSLTAETKFDVYSVSSTDGSDLRRHTHDNFQYYSPSFAGPNRLLIIKTSSLDEGPSEIGMLNFDSNIWTPLTDGSYVENDPDWV
jgi:Tol biopolymer transport system component